MEIIIHGKPNAGSANFTSGLNNSFAQRLIDEFFASMNSIKGSDVLIVDARYWQNVWYSVYTYWLGSNKISDTANRDSFLAISVIVPHKYYCLVSEVHKWLKNVYKDYVVGTYISSTGKYIVQNFADSHTFDGLVARIRDDHKFINLEEPFDSEFIPKTALTNNVFYNIEDCDSKAFVNTLKTCGRIIVSCTTSSKDELLAEADQHVHTVTVYKEQLNEKQSKIIELENKINDLQEQINEKTKPLESNEEEVNETSNLNNTPVKNKTVIKKTLRKTLNTFYKKPWLLPLIILLSILLISIIKWVLFTAHNPTPDYNYNGEDTSTVADNYNTTSNIVENEDTDTTAYNDSFNQNPNKNIDVDCNLMFYQEGRLIKNQQEVDWNKPVQIKIDSLNGYKWHSYNVKQETIDLITQGAKFTLQRKDKNDTCIICYRSQNIKNRNENNLIKIAPKQQ